MLAVNFDLPQYILQHENLITHAIDQRLPLWYPKYDNFLQHGHALNLVYLISQEHHSVTRAELCELIRNNNDNVVSFYLILVWGNILSGRGGIRNLKLILNDNRLGSSINTVSNLMNEGKWEQAFNELSTGDAKIKGLGISFFTKVLYFLGQNNNNILTKPLIFDSFLQQAYFTLLLQSNRIDEAFHCFHRSGEAKKQYLPIVYKKFVKDMNEWASIINVRPSKLEEFLFGRRDKKADNPRVQLTAIRNNILNHN